MQVLRLPAHRKFSVDARVVAAELISMHFAANAEPHAALSQRAVISLWQRNEEFRGFFSEVLSRVPFEAFRWETAPILRGQTDAPFECVLIESPALATIAADASPFEKHIASGYGTHDVRTFANLRGDARLIVPCASSPKAQFAHLAVFLRTAPPAQIHRLWQAVASGVGQVIEDKLWQPIWLSTAGLGVSWLHVRIDSEPKYYHHQPYTLAP